MKSSLEKYRRITRQDKRRTSKERQMIRSTRIKQELEDRVKRKRI